MNAQPDFFRRAFFTTLPVGTLNFLFLIQERNMKLSLMTLAMLTGVVSPLAVQAQAGAAANEVNLIS